MTSKRLAEEFATSKTVMESMKRNLHYLGDDFMGHEACQSVLDAFIEVLANMSDLDPTSYAFRYPVAKSLKSTTPTVSGLNLPNLLKVAERLEVTFGWIRRALELNIDGSVNKDLRNSEIFDSTGSNG